MARGTGIRLGRLLGADVLLKPAWFVVAAGIGLLLAPRVREELPGIGTVAPLVGLAVAAALLASVLVHEIAHAAAARATGTPVREIVLDLWGGHTTMDEVASGPGAAAVVAAVGPAASAAIAALTAWVAMTLPPGSAPRLLLATTATANALVAALNALPGLPMDGGRVLEALLWWLTGDRTRAALIAGWCGIGLAAGFLAWGTASLAGRVPGTGWLILLAGFVWVGASGAVRTARWHRRVPALSVRGLLRPAVGVVSTASLADADAQAGEAGAADVVVLDIYGRPSAVVDAAESAGVPTARRCSVRATAVAYPLDHQAVLPDDLVGEGMVERLRAAQPQPVYAVVNAAGGVVGVIDWGDIEAALDA